MFIHVTCAHCGYIDYLTVGEYLLHDTALISFCLGHDVDVTSGPIWNFEFAATDTCVTMGQTDPWTSIFTYLDADTIQIDDSLVTTTSFD